MKTLSWFLNNIDIGQLQLCKVLNLLFLLFHNIQSFLAPLEHICACALYSHGCQVISLCSPIHGSCQTTPYDSNGSLKAWQRCIPFAVWQGWAAMVSAHLVPHLPSTPFPFTRALFQVCGYKVYPDSQSHYAAQRDSWLQCHALIPRIYSEQWRMFFFSFALYHGSLGKEGQGR